MTWYIVQDGQPKEIPEEVLIYKIKNREIGEDVWVVNEEIKEWTALKDTQLYKQYAPINSTETTASSTDAGQAQEAGGRNGEIDERSVATFVGKNQSYYLLKWKTMRATRSKVSWNWSSFLLSTYWMLYRKMYVPAMIKLVIDWALNYMGILGNIVSLGLWIVCGLFGNYLYFQHMEKAIVEANMLSGFARTNHLEKKGGTTIVPVVIIGVFYVALYVFLIIGIAALYSI